MKVEEQKSGHVFQKYILDRISEIEGVKIMARNPMEVVVDNNGAYWLCDEGVEQEEDLEERGCWRCREKFIMR